MAIIGENIILREVKPEDYKYDIEMRNDLETQAWSQSLPPDYTLEMARKKYQNREYSFSNNDAFFTIVEKESESFVGMIGIYGIKHRFDGAYGIKMLKTFWGKGYAYEAQELILKFLFTELGLRTVRLWTTGINHGMIKLAEKSGFKISARIREGVYKNGILTDSIMMDILREEYYEKHPELQPDNLPII